MDPSIFSTILIRRHVLPRNDIHGVGTGLAPHLLRQGTHGPAGLMALGGGHGRRHAGSVMSPTVQKAARELKKSLTRSDSKLSNGGGGAAAGTSSPDAARMRRMQSTGSFAVRRGPPGSNPGDASFDPGAKAGQ